MTNEEIFNIISPIVKAVTGVPNCILANPNYDAPKGPYCSIQPTQSIRKWGKGRRVYKCEGDVLTEDVRAQIIAECSINFYRKDALEFPKLLLDANCRSDVMSALILNKLGWSHTSDIRNLTALQAHRKESRSQISIYLTYETSNPHVINYIERVRLTVGNQETLIDTGTLNER